MKNVNQTSQIFSPLNRISREDLSLLFFQLLAWHKLEQDGKIKSEASFSALASDTISVFKVYARLNALSEQMPAFRVNEKALESLSGDELAEIIRFVQEINLSAVDYSFVSNLAQSNYISRNRGEYVLPSEICDLMVKLAGVGKKTSVICPFNNPEWLAFKAAKVSKDVTIYDERENPLPHLLNILLEKQVKILVDEEPSEVYQQKFDVFLAKPSFNPADNTEEIRYIAEHTGKHAVVLVPNNFLFRTVSEEFQLKKEMFIEKAIESVISLPGGLLPNTNIPFSLIVLNRSAQTDEVFFVDATGDEFVDAKASSRNLKIQPEKIIEIVRKRKNGKNSVLVSTDAVRENEFNLSPERYLLHVQESEIFKLLEKSEVKTLDELSELYRPQSVRDYETPDGEEFFEVSVSDIGEDNFVQWEQAKKVYLKESFKTRFDNLILQPFDILLPIKGSVGKVGMVDASGLDGKAIANQSLIIIRKKEDSPLINSFILFLYLTSEIGQTLLKTYTSGTTIPFIQMRDVRALPVPILSVEKQQKIFELHTETVRRFEEIGKIKGEINKLRKEIRNVFAHSA